MSIELQSAFEKDMAVIGNDGKVDYVDNQDIVDTSAETKDAEAESQKDANIAEAKAEANAIAEAEYNNQQEAIAQQELDLSNGF